MNRENLLPYIEKIESGEIKKAELREFIEICCRIGVSCLNKKYHKHKKLFAQNGITFIDIAVDAVTPLFIINENLNLIEIKKSLLNWGNKITKESESSFFIYSIVWKRVDQTINQILAEVDPLYNKILNNVLYLIRTNKYKKIYLLGQAYLVESEYSKILGSLITDKELNEIPIHLIKNRFDNALNNIFDYITNHTKHFPAIPLNYFVNRIKNLYTNEIITLDYIENNNESSIYISQILNDSLTKLNLFIEKNYVDKHKRSQTEGEIFKKVIKDIAIDLSDGGLNRRIEEYLMPYLTSLTNEELKLKFHNILDYLYRLLKKDLINALGQNKFSQMA